MEYENLDYPSAIRRLADRASITIIESENDPRAREQAQGTTPRIHQQSADWFHQYLMRLTRLTRKKRDNILRIGDWVPILPSAGTLALPPTVTFSRNGQENQYSGKLMAASGLMSLREKTTHHADYTLDFAIG